MMSSSESVSRELASKAYYKVKTVVWTPFWPSGTADREPSFDLTPSGSHMSPLCTFPIQSYPVQASESFFMIA
jgi:hypothetical protein